MPAEERPNPRPLSDHNDVYGLLHEVRLRPGVWVRGLQELETILAGYGMALLIHNINEPFPFSAHGDFKDWLQDRFGWGMSLGWAYAIEHYGGATDPLELFFQLVDEYRAAGRPTQT